MAGRLGVDFGTSNTVISLWNEGTGDASVLQLKDYSKAQYIGGESLFITPSLIHYTQNLDRLYGNEILQRNLYHSPRTFQWMKRYICSRNPMERRLDGIRLDNFDAGKHFLSEILLTASSLANIQDEEIALTVPVEAFDDYVNWLANVAHIAKIGRFKIIDEPSAAALGYGIKLVPGDAYLVFDFGGGTLDVAIVRVEENMTELGLYCKVMGKAGIDMGGTSIDEWLYEEVLKRNGRKDSDEEVKLISRSIIGECERMKEALSFKEKAEMGVLNPVSGSVTNASFTRTEFENLLDERDAFSKIDRTVRRALTAAQGRGCDDDQIQFVLMVGGCSQIPAVQKVLRRIFGNDRVMLKRPLDAVARGASAFIAGVAFEDYIQHDYAIRYVNPTTGGYEYRPLVKRGTRYPSQKPLAVITVKASFEDQPELGLPIFEISGNSSTSGEERLEVFFDASGHSRMRIISHSEGARRNFHWINENNPTFLKADPPAKKGEPRFRLEFAVDTNRRLLITAHDLKDSRLVYEDYPVAKLI